MKTTFKLLMFLFTACAAADAQVVPEATGPTGLPVSGDLHYVCATPRPLSSVAAWATGRPPTPLEMQVTRTATRVFPSA